MLVLNLDMFAFSRGISEVYLGRGRRRGMCLVSEAVVYILAYMGHRVGGFDFYTDYLAGDNGGSLGLLWDYSVCHHTMTVVGGGVCHVDAWSFGCIDLAIYLNDGELWVCMDRDYINIVDPPSNFILGESGFIVYDFGDIEGFSDSFMQDMLCWFSGLNHVFLAGSGFINACFGLAFWESFGGVWPVMLRSLNMLKERGLWYRGMLRDDVLDGLPDVIMDELKSGGFI